MLKNHFKIAFRNLFNHKTFSTINILGLAVGIAGFLLVALWAQSEFQYNQFHQNADRIYQILGNQAAGEGKVMTVAAIPGPLGTAIKAEVPEVSQATLIILPTSGCKIFIIELIPLGHCLSLRA